MISKERLEELIKQESIIYAIHIPYEQSTDDMNIMILPIKITTYSFLNPMFLYETEEEAKFAIKNNAQRLERFEPPFELRIGEKYTFISRDYEFVTIFHFNSEYIEDIYVIKGNKYLKETSFYVYQEAVDYARKLFKGEE